MQRLALGVCWVALLAVGFLWMLRGSDRDRGSTPPADATPAERSSPTRSPLTAPNEEETERRTASPTPSPPERARRLVTEGKPTAAGAKLVLTGRVRDLGPLGDAERATPAAGVRVWAQVGGFLNFGSDLGESQTDEEGGFRLTVEVPERRPLTLKVWAAPDERYQATNGVCRLETADSSPCEPLELLRRPVGALEGRAVDLTGQPLEGVEIALLDWDQERDTLDRVVASGTTAADGHFQLLNAGEFREIRARKEGYALVSTTRPGRDKEGRWTFCEVVLAPDGALAVTVTTASGQPVEGLQALLRVASREPFGTMRPFGGHQVLRALTDAEGRLAWESVWAHQHLRMDLIQPNEHGSSQPIATVERVHKGSAGWEALRSGEAGGKPLALEAGAQVELRVRLGGRLRIEGQVVTEEGVPLEEPSIVLLRVDETGPARLVSARGDENGHFGVNLTTAEPLGRVLVTASDAKNPFHIRAPQRAGWELLDLSAQTEGLFELELVARELLAIRGVVRAGEEPQRARIRCHPKDALLPFGRLPSGVHPLSYTRKEGRIHVGGLAPGSYDLEILPSADYAGVWVRDVPAGTDDLVVELDAPRKVRLQVEVVQPDDGELEETVFLRAGPLVPFGPPPEAPALERERTLAEPFGWVPWPFTLWSGGGGHTDEQGSVSVIISALRENPAEVALDPGLYWLGAKARYTDDSLTFPIGTGLVRLEPGAYRLRLEMPPAAGLKGRVRGAAEGLRIALAHGDGRLIPLNQGGEAAATTLELGFAGTFQLTSVPAGRLEVRVGSEAELQAGAWTKRVEVHAARGETAEVEIEL